ncbi:MAG: DNA ligase D [Candidatus Dormibacteria bacterium]
MPLEEYRRKRDFARTPEPSGAAPVTSGDSGWHDLGDGRRYCVQMHRATRMHYDFRIEWNGVLLSWAVPRGPSLDPANKRLAVQTEDHPIDYGDFEGIIPSGYGMGTVELWDIGTYEWTRESADDPERQIAVGDIKFALQGRKLAGEFALVRIGERGRRYGGSSDGDRNFLMIKKGDGAVVSGHDAADHDVSVKTGRTLADIAAEGGGDPRELQRARRRSPRGGGHEEPTAATRSTGAQAPSISALPAPMLATAVDRAFNRPGWLFELKYDGVRAMIGVDDGKVRVVGRRGRDETDRYPEVAVIPAHLTAMTAVLDAEIVVLDQNGRPDFEQLQSRINLSGLAVAAAQEKHPATIVVFDILAMDGRNLMDTDLRIRKKTLHDIVIDGGPLLYADHVDGDGESLFAAVAAQGVEGIIAKRGESRYQPGRRTSDWLKVKAWQTQSCIIAGWTQGHGRRGKLGALVLAIRDGGDLVFAGCVGTGFDEAALTALLGDLQGRTENTCPLRVAPKLREPVTWVTPDVVCEVRHAGWTRAGSLRHPSYQGLRPDVAAADCVREVPLATDAVIKGAGPPSAPPLGRGHRRTSTPSPGAPDPEIADALERLAGLKDNDAWQVGGRRVRLTNLDKVFWPESGFSKRDMIAHYVGLAPYLLPYIRDRPLSSQVFPDGITGKSFWRKDKPSHAPEWISAWTYHGDEKTKNYIVVNEVATLAWVANNGVVDLHPWHSRVDEPHRPDWAVFDLDPFEPSTFADVRDIAKMVKAALDHYGLHGVVKTSGQTGLQIYVPIRRGPRYGPVLRWVEEVGRAIGRADPGDRVSWEWAVAKRTGKIRIDYTQNIINKTLAGPYSLRPAPGAPVSTPIAWEELDDPKLRPDSWNIRTIAARVAEVGDLFTGVLAADQDLPGTP